MKAAIRVDFLLSFAVALVSTAFLFTCAAPIVRAFIDDAETVRYGQLFQRIICITGPCISVTMLAITVFQSVGKKAQPAILSLLRKGGLDIPFMFLLNALAGVEGIVWATPIADFGAMLVALMLFIPFWRTLRQEQGMERKSSGRGHRPFRWQSMWYNGGKRRVECMNESIENRRSIRKYQDAPVSRELLEEVLRQEI